MWPIIGLKRAVIVVGGSETEEEGEGEEENREDGDGGGSSDDGASGKVVNRMPVDTVRRPRCISDLFAIFRRADGDEGARTSCALLLGTEVDFGAGGDPALEPAFHRILLVYPLLHLHPRPTAGRCGALGLVGGGGAPGE